MGRISLGARPALATYPPRATLGPRTLEDFELVWVMTGSAQWHWIDTALDLVLQPGMLLLTRPGMHEEFRWDRHAPTRHGYVHFDTQPRPDTSGWPLVRSAIGPGPIAGLLDYLLWLGEEPVHDWTTHAEQTIQTLLHMFVSAPLPETPQPTEPPALAAALDHVQAEWRRRMRPISLAELATAAQVSKEHLGRLFQQRYGTGIVGALELVRLDRAATLLTRSNLNITEIASTCGFDDPLHFSKRFRATHGVSPRGYRQSDYTPSPLAAARLLPLRRRITAG